MPRERVECNRKLQVLILLNGKNIQQARRKRDAHFTWFKNLKSNENIQGFKSRWSYNVKVDCRYRWGEGADWTGQLGAITSVKYEPCITCLVNYHYESSSTTSLV
jgi:hypothetical protein